MKGILGDSGGGDDDADDAPDLDDDTVNDLLHGDFSKELDNFLLS